MYKASLSILLLGVLYLGGGCATLPEKIAPAVMNDDPYKTWNCDQLCKEQPRLSAALASASDAQRLCRKKDIAGLLFIGLPVGSLMGCRKTEEIARLKGELQALQHAAVEVHCPLDTATIDSSLKVDTARSDVTVNAK